jgi:hypothetical protein
MFSTIHTDGVDLSPKMTVFGLSDVLDFVPGASYGLLTSTAIRLRGRLLLETFLSDTPRSANQLVPPCTLRDRIRY